MATKAMIEAMSAKGYWTSAGNLIVMFEDSDRVALDAVAEGIVLSRCEQTDGIPNAIKRIFQYSGLCGYALMARSEKRRRMKSLMFPSCIRNLS